MNSGKIDANSLREGIELLKKQEIFRVNERFFQTCPHCKGKAFEYKNKPTYGMIMTLDLVITKKETKPGMPIACDHCEKYFPVFYEFSEKNLITENFSPTTTSEITSLGDEATITTEGDNVVISYLDTMTFVQAWQKLIVDAGIPYCEWVDVEDFFPVNKKSEKIKENVTGKRVVEKTKNVLDLTHEMCNISADKSLKSGKKYLSPIAYLRWFVFLYKQGKYLDEKTWTIFPNWRNSAGYILCLSCHPDRRKINVYNWGPDNPIGDIGVRPLIG